MPGPAAPPAGSRPLAALPQSLGELHARHLQRRREPEQHARRQRNAQGEGERREVHADLLEAWQIGRRRGHQCRHAPARENEPDAPSDHAQQRTLSEKLSDQSRAPAADGRPHHHLAGSRRRPREEQVGDVRARNQEYKRDRPEQHVERRPRVPYDHVLKRQDDDGLVDVADRVLALETCGDRRHLGLRLFEPHVGAQPPDHPIVVRGA
jgi:hypothetical protein